VPLRARQPLTVLSHPKVYNQSLFWRRAAHERLGELDQTLDLLADADLLLGLLKNETPQNWLRTDQVLGAFRLHPGQKTTHTALTPQRVAEELYLSRKHGFAQPATTRGRINLLLWRLIQLQDCLQMGGFRYTMRMIYNGVRQRRGVL
jgi:hypothetical protein